MELSRQTLDLSAAGGTIRLSAMIGSNLRYVSLIMLLFLPHGQSNSWPNLVATLLAAWVLYLGVAIALPVKAAQPDQPSVSPPAAGEESHRQQNPIYSQLLAGVAGQIFTEAIALPNPQMPDGLTADEQEAVLKKVAEPRYPLQRFTAPRVEAPHVLEIEHQPLDDSQKPLERNQLDLYFVAQGTLQDVADPEFLKQVFAIEEADQAAEKLSAETLSQAGIDPAQLNDEREFYNRLDAMIFDRIHLTGVGHSFWSKTAESILFAVHVDRRFNQDPSLAASWERFERQEDGSMQPAEEGEYPGAGAYLKITQLNGRPGQLFIEAHGVLLEPYSWFRGRSLLVSKLPPLIRSQVKDIRRRSQRAGQR